MFFVITKNQRPYKSWGHRSSSFNENSIFTYERMNRLFYITTTYEESPPYLVHIYNKKEPRMITSKGDAEILTMKDDFYNFLVNIINRKGSLSHYPRKTYKLEYGNGADLPEFQESKYKSCQESNGESMADDAFYTI